jgi:thymidylate kinase
MSRIREGYLALSKQDPRRWFVVECAEKTGEEIFDAVTCELSSRRGLFDI